MWLLIARSLLPSGTKIDSVNMLGGRNAVTEACALDQTNTGRKKLYIIDGDFDFLLSRRVPRLKYFCRVKANNIENLLLSGKAFVATGLEHAPLANEYTLSKSLDYDRVVQNLEEVLKPLFVVYAVVHKLCPSIQTTGYSVFKLTRKFGSSLILDKLKVGQHSFKLYLRAARQVRLKVLREMRVKIQQKAEQLSLNQIVSGKDYLLPLLLSHFRSVCGYPRGNENFKVALARSYLPSSDPNFQRRMKNLAA